MLVHQTLYHRAIPTASEEFFCRELKWNIHTNEQLKSRRQETGPGYTAPWHTPHAVRGVPVVQPQELLPTTCWSQSEAPEHKLCERSHARLSRAGSMHGAKAGIHLGAHEQYTLWGNLNAYGGSYGGEGMNVASTTKQAGRQLLRLSFQNHISRFL